MPTTQTHHLNVPQLPAAAADCLRAWIIAGRLRPNERVRERQFADRFGISRTPLREALRVLQQEGLITGDPRRGMQVSPLSVDEITGAYQVLAALERSALLHTPEVTPQMVQRLRAATRKRQAAGSDVGRSCGADLEWHRALTGFTSNRILERMLEAPRFIAERYERAFFRSIPDVARSSAEHERIETAVGAGKLDEAGGLVEAHWLGNIPAMTEIISRTE